VVLFPRSMQVYVQTRLFCNSFEQLPGYKDCMQMISGVFERFFLRLGVQRQHARLILIIFAVSLIARGGVFDPGFSIDDYVVSYDDAALTYGTFFSQGRFLHAAIFRMIDAMGVNASDIYIVFGILAILLQAAFVVSILRFVGVDKIAGVWLVGALIAVHPYGTEIFTFRMALPGYCAGMLFSIIALETIARHPSRLTAGLLAFLATLAMAFTYQVFVNYFLVTILFAWAFGEIASGDQLAQNRQRALILAAVTVSSMVTFLAVTGILSWLGVVIVETRAHLITQDMVPERLWEMTITLVRIYMQSESIMPAWLKALLWILLGTSVIGIVKWHWQNARHGERLTKAVGLLLLAVVLVPLSLGVIIFSQEWWPSYRVVSHLAVIGGLVLIIGDYCAAHAKGLAVGRFERIGRGFALFVFVLMSNQIFADQRKLNAWDLMTATRLVARLEEVPEFRNVHYIHFTGGWGGYPSGLRTTGGNLNVSEFAVPWGRTKLLVAASGYQFETATGERQVAGDNHCKTAPTWPDRGSIKVEGDLAIICFPR
jgi:hypothetical protein